MKEQMRQSPLIHANETGWRENGQNGYPWAFPTAREQGIRYYEYDHSRKQAVAARILVPSEGQPGATWLISDFYCCYNDCARPKPCWLCLQGAVHYLKEEQAQDRAVLTWAGDVAAVRAAVERMTPTTEAGQTKVRCTLAYLTEHSHRLGYPELWVAGYPIRSGTVESACNTLVGGRLKPGQRWSEAERLPCWRSAVLCGAIAALRRGLLSIGPTRKAHNFLRWRLLQPFNKSLDKHHRLCYIWYTAYRIRTWGRARWLRTVSHWS